MWARARLWGLPRLEERFPWTLAGNVMVSYANIELAALGDVCSACINAGPDLHLC